MAIINQEDEIVQYDNSGIIGKNERKSDDKHPDITGSATVDGVEYWMSGWSNEKNGRKFYTLKFKVKDQKPQERKASSSSDIDDEIPF